MQFRDHPGVQGKRDAYPFDPRMLKVDAGYNVRELDSPEERPDLDDLKEQIRSNGVRTPLEVRLREDDVFIVAGHRRHKVVLELISEGEDIKTVPVMPEPKGTNEADRIVSLVVSNSGKPLKPLQVAEVVRRLVAFGWDKGQIAQRLGWRSTASVNQYLDMLAMPEPIKEHVRNGEISATLARNIAKGVDPKFAEDLIAANLAENKRLKGKHSKVTAKTIKRDKATSQTAKEVRPTENGQESVNARNVETAADPIPPPDTDRPSDAEAVHQICFLPAMELLVERTRAAVSYHQLGYNSGSEFEANEMLARMDNLAHALNAYDLARALHTYAAKETAAPPDRSESQQSPRSP